MKKLSWQTESGIRKSIAILMALILLFSAVAELIQHDGTKIVVTRVHFDTRGGAQDADLYYPQFTSSHSEKIPIVILSHGGGCTKDVLNTFAGELARRGIAVLNCSSYGAGLSDQPMYDENDKGYGDMAVTSQGVWDAVNYARTLVFVDQTKIGIAGHSQGGYRTGLATALDALYLTLDQIMINFMYNEFGIEFTEEEIYGDCFELAEKYLNADQMEFFKNEYEEAKLDFDTRVKASCSVGSASKGAEKLYEAQEVQVAGYTISNLMQVNTGFLIGRWDGGSKTVTSPEVSQEFYGVDQTVSEQWLRVGGYGEEGVVLGNLFDEGMQSNEALRAAIDARQARIVMVPNMTHSREFFSNEAAAQLVAFFVTAFDYNATGVPATKIVARWREYMNTGAMICMIGLAAAFIALFSKKKYFAGIVAEHDEGELAPMNKGMNAAYLILNVAAIFYACYRCHQRKPVIWSMSKFLPIDKTGAFMYIYLFFAGLFALVIVAAFAFINKKKNGDYGLKKLGIGIGFKNVLKAFLVSYIVFVICYLSMSVIEYWFGQDYRWWMCVFTQLKTYHWPMMLRYFILIVPCTFALAALTNYNVTPEKASTGKKIAEMALVIVIGSLGIWLNHFLNMYGCWILDKELSSASICGGLIMFVPLSVYIFRKTYRVTGSIWTGAFLNALFVSWSWVSAISITNVYMGATYFEKFFGI